MQLSVLIRAIATLLLPLKNTTYAPQVCHLLMTPHLFSRTNVAWL
nr:MAG TPA: hypothetical protein [Caudoviricetes sp.]